MPSVTDELFDEHAIIAHLRDGRVVAWSEYGAHADFGTDGEYDSWLQRLPDLKYIEKVIDVEFDYGIPTSDKVHSSGGIDYKMNIYEGVGKSIFGNVVGMTLLGQATNLSGGTLTAVSFGTSVFVDIVAVGPP